MSPELHEILSKTKQLEEDVNGIDQADGAKHAADEVKVEEETPLQQQQDGDIQLKEQTVLKQENEEVEPLQAKVDAEEPAKEDTEEQKAEEIEKKAEEVEEMAEKREEAAPLAAIEQEGSVEEKKEEEAQEEDKPPSAPQE